MIHYMEQSAFQHRFWLQILGDHSRFIYTELSPKENGYIKTAQEFIMLFDNLLAQARQPMDATAWQTLAREALTAATSLRTFKLEIIKKHLANAIDIGLTPTFINHMVNEVEEYISNLGYLVRGQIVPPKNPVHHHLLWVKDAEGHATGLYCDLDYSQTKLRKKAEEFMKLFLNKYSETVEFAGFLRTCVLMFPSLGQFNKDVACKILDFKHFLHHIKDLLEEDKAIGSLDPLIPDHFIREECYYLHELHRSDPVNVPRPDCDPTQPRITG